MTKYFLDWEFIEDGRTIDPISLGVVSENGREFYVEFDDVDWTKANVWVVRNVKPHLRGTSDVRSRAQIAGELLKFINAGPDRPEFWGYYADYDWVVLCQLYGTMMDLPASWPMFCMDLKQLAVSLGNPELPEQTGTEHNALEDARWNKEVWEYLTRLELD